MTIHDEQYGSTTIEPSIDQWLSQSRIALKLQFGTDIRRLSVEPNRCDVLDSQVPIDWTFDLFRSFVRKVFNLSAQTDNVLIFYQDDESELLPVTNDMNLRCMLRQTQTSPLRIFVVSDGCDVSVPVQIEGMINRPDKMKSEQPLIQRTHVSKFTSMFRLDHAIGTTKEHIKRTLSPKERRSTFSQNTNRQRKSPKQDIMNIRHIDLCKDFRLISSIIDTDILPTDYRRVRLRKQGEETKPLGFYVRDGLMYRPRYPNGPVDPVSGIFISKLLPGGLAECTGLLSINDEIVEVNGIPVIGKSLDQVTDMMVANSGNLILTVKPSDQRYNLSSDYHSRSDCRRSESLAPTNTRWNSYQINSQSSDEDFVA